MKTIRRIFNAKLKVKWDNIEYSLKNSQNPIDRVGGKIYPTTTTNDTHPGWSVVGTGVPTTEQPIVPVQDYKSLCGLLARHWTLGGSFGSSKPLMLYQSMKVSCFIPDRDVHFTFRYTFRPATKSLDEKIFFSSSVIYQLDMFSVIRKMMFNHKMD